MRERTPNRSGNIYQERDRRWVGRVMIDGKRIAIRATSYEAAREKLDRIILEKTGAPAPDSFSAEHDWQLLRRDVLARDGRRCRYCGAETNGVDHVTPRSAGGADTPENLVACCPSCNSLKGARLPTGSKIGSHTTDSDAK